MHMEERLVTIAWESLIVPAGQHMARVKRRTEDEVVGRVPCRIRSIVVTEKISGPVVILIRMDGGRNTGAEEGQHIAPPKQRAGITGQWAGRTDGQGRRFLMAEALEREPAQSDARPTSFRAAGKGKIRR